MTKKTEKGIGFPGASIAGSLMWVLGTKLWSSEKAESALNH